MLTITLKPSGKGHVTATSSDGHSFLTTTPLCNGARYWLDNGADSATYIVTIWSSASTEWAMRAPVIAAAKLTVDESKTPRFGRWKPFPHELEPPALLGGSSQEALPS